MVLELNGITERSEGWCGHMHKPIIYKNNRNEKNEFGTRELFINNLDLYDYNWKYDTDFGRVGNFRRETQEKKLTISIYGKTEAEANQRKNDVFEVFEKDVLANNPGKLWVGDYYLSCYITEGKVSKYYRQGNYLAKEIKIITDTPVWIKETTYNFYMQAMEDDNSFYPYGYPYDYSNNLFIQSITNNHYADCNFELTVYGPALNPTVFIKGHPYTVNTDLLAGEYLTINSTNKTIIKTKINGERINEFNKRGKEYSVFKLVEQGQNTVSWDEQFNFDLTLFDERSEPKWI